MTLAQPAASWQACLRGGQSRQGQARPGTVPGMSPFTAKWPNQGDGAPRPEGPAGVKETRAHPPAGLRGLPIGAPHTTIKSLSTCSRVGGTFFPIATTRAANSVPPFGPRAYWQSHPHVLFHVFFSWCTRFPIGGKCTAAQFPSHDARRGVGIANSAVACLRYAVTCQ